VPARAWGFKSPLRHNLSHLRHSHGVCRVSWFPGHLTSGIAFYVTEWACDRHPHARHDRGRVCAGHRPVAQQRVSPCKRLANTPGRWEMPVVATSALMHPGRHRGVPSAPWGPRQRCRLMGRRGEIRRVGPTGDQARSPAGRCRHFHAGWRDTGRLHGSARSATPTPNRRRAPDAVRCSAPRARPPTFWRG
jgi:hypothetical protein